MFRTRRFDVIVAKQLRKRTMAREFVLAGQMEGETLQASVADLIRSYGIEEFVHDYSLSRSAVYRLMARKGNYYSTMEKILGKLKLKLWALGSKQEAEILEKAA